MDTTTGAGITVEYYDGTDLSSSDEETLSVHYSTSSSFSPKLEIKKAEDDAEFKTYDFQHWELEKEIAEDEDLSNRKLFSDSARDAMNRHYAIIDQEHMESLLHPRASFSRCPKGDVVEEPHWRRKFPGPFLTCSFGHSHECGDEFHRLPESNRSFPKFDLSCRPRLLKEKKVKFFKQCKNCEYNGFTHHRNPAQHYEDYVNNVTNKNYRSHTKVWLQHLTDFKHAFETLSNEKLGPEYSEVIDKCKHYRPSTVIANAAKLSEKLRMKRTVIARKKTALTHPLRRQASRAGYKYSGYSNSARARSQRRKDMYRETGNSNPASARNSKSSKSASVNAELTRLMKRQESPKETDSIHSSVDSSSPRPTSRMGTAGNRRPRSALQRRLKASVTKLINTRQAQSKISKQFVKKPKPPKEAKYIQKVKPNISAKILRARSKGKPMHWSSNPIKASPTKDRAKGNKREEKSSKKVFKQPNLMTDTKTDSKRSTSSNSSSSRNSNYSMSYNSADASTSDNGSYSQFRDHNGEFDTEKYRKSILKMLAKPSGTGAKRERKKQQRKVSPSQTSQKFMSLVSLPKIKNMYSNVKSKTVSNVPQKKKRKQGRKSKSKSDALFDLVGNSDVSLKSKFSNNTLDNRDSYFSIPGLDDVKLK